MHYIVCPCSDLRPYKKYKKVLKFNKIVCIVKVHYKYKGIAQFLGCALYRSQNRHTTYITSTDVVLKLVTAFHVCHIIYSIGILLLRSYLEKKAVEL